MPSVNALLTSELSQVFAEHRDPLPFDAEAARVYGRIFAATRAAGRSRRSRVADLFIASIAVANGLPLYTRNPSDFAGFDEFLEVIAV